MDDRVVFWLCVVCGVVVLCGMWWCGVLGGGCGVGGESLREESVGLEVWREGHAGEREAQGEYLRGRGVVRGE